MNFNTYNHTDENLTELEELLTLQSNDDTDVCKGEFLGGNGQAMPWQCKGKENTHGSRDTMSDELKELYADYSPELLPHHNYQDTIEENGNYNVRQLSSWKGGFNPITYAKREARIVKAKASHGYKFDKRRHVGTLCREERIERNLAKIATIEAKQARAMAKRLARLS